MFASQNDLDKLNLEETGVTESKRETHIISKLPFHIVFFRKKTTCIYYFHDFTNIDWKSWYINT